MRTQVRWLPLLILFLVSLMLTGSAGCSWWGHRTLNPQVSSSPQALLERAHAAFQNGDYNRAANLFKSFVFRYPTDPRVDEAQFFLAECYFRQQDYDQAIAEYSFLVENFPQSPYRERAELRLAESYYRKAPSPELDQTDTETAIRQLRRFLSRYPNSPYADTARKLLAQAKEKLAEKMLIAIRTYRNLEAWRAERLYIRLLEREYPQTTARWWARYYLAEYYIQQDQPDSAYTVIHDIVAREKELPHKLVRKTKELGLKYGLWPFRRPRTS